jgi:hypothetical protein
MRRGDIAEPINHHIFRQPPPRHRFRQFRCRLLEYGKPCLIGRQRDASLYVAQKLCRRRTILPFVAWLGDEGLAWWSFRRRQNGGAAAQLNRC